MKQVDVVGAVIWNSVGEVLCAQRSESMPLPGLWEFPGGKIEPGEEHQEALRREIWEELGCTVAVGELVADTVHAYPHAQVRLTTYHAVITEGTPVPAEHERLVWLPPLELPTLEWAPADVPAVERLAAGCRPGKGSCS